MLYTNIIKTFYNSLNGLKILTTLICCVIFLSAGSQSAYVKKYRPIADSLSEEYGIPVSIILGVAILESGSGTSRNARLMNNHFGIAGKNRLLKTKGIRSRYKQYITVEASYVDFCMLLAKRKYYKRLKGTKDYRPWIEAISNAGYSEMPEEWKKRITATIKKNKLSTIH